jgi:hypothetical protein
VRRALDAAKLVALLAATALCAYTVALERSAKAGAAALAPKFAALPADVHALVLPTQKLEATWAAAGLTFAQTAAKERDAFAAQQDSYLRLTNRGVNVLDAAATATLKFGEAADSLKTIAPAVTAQVEQVGADVRVTLTATRAMAEAVTADLNDPAIKASLANVEGLTAALKTAAEHGDKVMLDVEKVADHYELKIDTPATAGQKFRAGAIVVARILGDFMKF